MFVTKIKIRLLLKASAARAVLVDGSFDVIPIGWYF